MEHGKGRQYTIELEKKPEPHIVEGSLDDLTEEEKMKRIVRIERAEKLGISMSQFDGEEFELEMEREDADKLEAWLYIMRDLEIPRELEERISQKHNSGK